MSTISRLELDFHLLSMLEANNCYGYQMKKTLSSQQVVIQFPTIYRALDDLRKRGCIGIAEGKEQIEVQPTRSDHLRRHVFVLLPEGKALLKTRRGQMIEMIKRVTRSLNQSQHDMKANGGQI